jgi:hypothetical protein
MQDGDEDWVLFLLEAIKHQVSEREGGRDDLPPCSWSSRRNGKVCDCVSAGVRDRITYSLGRCNDSSQ